jgi:hypothetical protein
VRVFDDQKREVGGDDSDHDDDERKSGSEGDNGVTADVNNDAAKKGDTKIRRAAPHIMEKINTIGTR